MQKDFWNDRYSENGFAYGTEPNDFLKEQFFDSGSNILCLAEGEGRNAVYLAKKGHTVTTVDISQQGIEKTMAFATENGVELDAICADLSTYSFDNERWDAIVMIFGHFPPKLRKSIHSKLYAALKSGGKVIIEAYSKEQLTFKTGGPMEDEMLYSLGDLKEDFYQFDHLNIEKIERDIHEGFYHNGHSSVIRLIAVKK
jgi:2-polyprenyl-3-methyl-5-hydroxy-6-metoxy-1,4-benzoquinol methylase